MIFEPIDGARLPERKKPNDVGLDAYVREDTLIPASAGKAVRVKVPLGFRVQLEETVRLTAINNSNSIALIPFPELMTVMHINPRSGCSSKGMAGKPTVFAATDEVRYEDIDGKMTRIQVVEMMVCEDGEAQYGFDADIASGTVDPDYTGEVCATVVSRHPEPWIIPAGTRICQCEVGLVLRVDVEKGVVKKNENRSEGFGTSGVN